MKIKIIYTLISLMATSLLYSQGLRRKMADDYFKSFEYYKAAPIYEEIANQSVKKNINDYEVLRKTAESYSKISNFKKSAYWYSKVVENTSVSKDDILSYIKVLLYNTDYVTAKEFINQHSTKYTNYPFLAEYKANISLVEDLMQDSANFTITPANINSGYGDFSPSYYKDGLVFVSKRRAFTFTNRKYSWDGENYHNIFYSKYDANNTPTKKAKLFDKVFNSKFHNGPITFNKSFDVAIFTRDDLDKMNKDSMSYLMLYTSKKDESGKWSVPAPLPFNSKTYSVGDPTLSDDGNTLYFSSDMPGGYGQTDIWKSKWNGSVWGTPINLGRKVNTAGKEMFPFIHSSGNLYFASDGLPGLGGLDLFIAYDIEKNSEVQNIGYPINTNMDDFGLIVDPTEKLGYMSSNRQMGKKKKNDKPTDNIYAVKLSIPKFILNITVKSESTNEKIEKATVTITNKKTGQVDTLMTDENGLLTTKLKPHTQYTYTVIKDGFDPVTSDVILTNGLRESKTFDQEVKMNIGGITLKVIVIDGETKLPISKVHIIIKHNKDEVTLNTDANGIVTTKLEKGSYYTIHAVHEDYMAHIDYTEKTDSINTQNLTINTIEDIIELDYFSKTGDVIKLQNIYYDYHLANLRPESKSELDELAHYLNHNPTSKVELSSHTDSKDGSNYNMTLSQQRSQSCVDYLISKGIAKDRLTAKGYGESKLVNKCKDGVTCTEEEHQQNRRTEVKILSK